MDTYFGDDPYNRQRIASNNGNPLLAAWTVYQSWSSRLIIESTYFSLLSIPQIIWKICDALIYVLLAYSLAQIINTNKDRRLDCSMICITLIFPIWKMCSAGWVGTSNNYIWTAAFALYAAIPWARSLRGERIPIHMHILGLLAFTYAINHEQLLALVLGLLIIYALYSWFTKHKVPAYVIVQFVLCICMIIFIATAPGNKWRADVDVKSYMPTFYMYSLPQRLYMMFMYTSKSLIIDNGICFFIMSLLLVVVTIVKKKELYVKLVASIPFVAALLFGPLNQISRSIFPPIQSYDLMNYFLIQDSTSSHQFVLLALYLCVYFSVFVTLFYIIDNKALAVFSLIVLCGGFATRLIMAGAATMFASGDRTASFLYYCVLFVTGLLVREVFNTESRRGIEGLQFTLYSFAALSVTSAFLFL